MSNPVSDEPITCASCEYRYPRSRAICPMCGTAAPAVEPIQPPLPVPNELSGADYQSRPSSSDNQPKPPHPGLRRLIPIVIVSTVLMVVSSVFYEAHKRNLAKESGSAELAATSAQPKVKKADRDTSPAIRADEFSMSSRQKWKPPSHPTQRKRMILSSCGRRSSEAMLARRSH